MGRDGLVGLICLAGSLVLWGASWGLPQPALVPIGPAYYPQLLLAATAFFSAALVVSDVLAHRRGTAAAAPAPAHYRLVILTFLIFALYVATLPWLGYRVATLGFVAGLQAMLDPPRGRRWLLVLATGALTMLITYWVFEAYLHVLLPRGRLTGF